MILSRAFLYIWYLHTITIAAPATPCSLLSPLLSRFSSLVWHRSGVCGRKGESGVSELIILARCDNRRFSEKEGKVRAKPTLYLIRTTTYAITSNRSRTSGSRDIYVLAFSYSLTFCLSLPLLSVPPSSLLFVLFQQNGIDYNDNFL